MSVQLHYYTIFTELTVFTYIFKFKYVCYVIGPYNYEPINTDRICFESIGKIKMSSLFQRKCLNSLNEKKPTDIKCTHYLLVRKAKNPP